MALRNLLPLTGLSHQHRNQSLLTVCCRFASNVAQQQENAPAATAAAPESAQVSQPASQGSRPGPEEEWTEVIDEKTGQPYYWNQKTGETTELGEPRPETRFKDSKWEEAASNASGPFQEGWREPPGRDLTYIYSVLGVGIGVAVGWFTQYLH